MRLRLLGSTSLKSESGADVLKDPQPKRLALLAYLAVAARGDVVRRDRLLAMFWPDATEKDARRSLNQAAHYLRQLVGADAVTGGVDTLGVNEKLLTCDVVDFDDAMKDGRHDAALDLYRGHMMDGFFVSGASDFEDWLAREREQRTRRAGDAAWALSDAASSGSAAVHFGERAYSLVPDESATRRMMSLYDRIGDRARAIDVYTNFARRLASDYDTKPAAETQKLIAEIRSRALDSGEFVMTADAEPAAAETAAAPFEPLPPQRPSQPVVSRRALGVGAAVVVSAVVAAVAIATFGADETDHQVVAVMPFAYHGSPDRAYIGEGVATLLASSLNGISDLRTVDPRSLFGAVSRGDSAAARTLDGARSIASSLGAGAIVIGDIIDSDGRLRISATYSLGDGTNDARVQADGESEKLFDVVDELASKLIAKRTPGVAAMRSAGRTTKSLPAWRQFVAGDAEYRAGDYSAAVVSLKKAIALDSTFALAQYRLATASNWTGESGTSVVATEFAWRYRDRLTPHDRAKLEAWRHHLTGRPDSAEMAYARLVDADPTDVESRYHLADIHFHNDGAFGRPLTSTWPEWSKVVALDPGHAGALTHAARVAVAMRSIERFDSITAHIGALELDTDRSSEIRVLRAFGFGDRAARVAAARGDYDRMTGGPRRALFETVAMVAGPRDVDDLLMPILIARNSFTSRESGLMLQRAQLELARGRLARAEATLDSAMRLDPGHTREFRALFALVPVPQSSRETRRAIASQLASIPRPTHPRGPAMWHFLRGMLALRAGDTTTASRHAAAIDTITGDGAQASAQAYGGQALRAELLRAAGRPEEALRELGPARFFSDAGVWAIALAHWRFLRADLLAETGRVDEALRWYATFPDRGVYDYMFVNAALLRSAELLERRGERDRAAAKYEELLAMWSDSQGMDSYVRDVRARLERLR